MVLSLHLDHVVLLVVDLLDSDLLRLYSSLLDFLQDAFLLRLQQADSVLNLDFIVGELVKAVIDFDHIFLLLCGYVDGGCVAREIARRVVNRSR